MQIGGQNRLKPNSHFTHSHKLHKIAISLALLLGGANVALAEESGGFIGLGIGGGGAKYNIKQEFYGRGKISHLRNFGGINYGFVAGYKQFFNDYFGLRYYANLDIYHNLKKTNDEYLGKVDITLINYGANVDFLGNFISSEMVDFGGFIGLGIGGNTLTGKYIKDMKDEIRGRRESGEKFNDTGFDMWLNVGLRTNIAKYHGTEVAVRVPFIPVKFIEHKQVGGNDYDSITAYTFGQTYSILARYTFSF